MNGCPINDGLIGEPCGTVAYLPALSFVLSPRIPQATADPPVNVASRVVWRAYLAADGLDDLELPISSLQARRRSATPSYLSIVVPAPVPYLSGIAARDGGEIVIKTGFADNHGRETLNEILRATFTSLRYDLGANSGSATLVGYASVPAGDAKTRTLRGISYRATSDGVRRVRCEPDMWLNPGDTASLGGGETMVVDAITYTISPMQASMEAIEGDA